MEKTSESQRIQWEMIISCVIGIFAILGSTIPLYIHTDSKLDAFQARNNEFHYRNQEMLQAIQQEMKDFHGRLERQDAEFKGKLEKQDAEFKAHLMHLHSKS
jgi:hypothetical protein